MRREARTDRLGRVFIGDRQIGSLERGPRGWSARDLKDVVVTRYVPRNVALTQLQQAVERSDAKLEQLTLPGVSGA